MTQATAVQALARGYRALGVKRWKRDAERGAGRVRAAAAERRGGRRAGRAPLPPVLVRAHPPRAQRRAAGRARPARRGARSRTPRARGGCSGRGDRAARREVAEFDTGAWSLYSERGAESTLNYHALTAGFLGGLCDRVKAPRLLPHVRPLRALRARADTDRRRVAAAGCRCGPHAHRALHALEGLDRQGPAVGHARDERLARLHTPARHALVRLAPAGPRPLPLRIEARGPSGPAGVEQRVFKITTPKKPKPPKQEPKRKEKEAAAPRTRRKGNSQVRDAAAAASRRQAVRGRLETTTVARRATRADPLAQLGVADAGVDAGLTGPRAALAEARGADDAALAGRGRAVHRAAGVALAGVDAALRDSPRRASSSASKLL